MFFDWPKKKVPSRPRGASLSRPAESAGAGAGRGARDRRAPQQSRTLQLAKGLTRKQAYAAASKQSKGRDFRGFTYDARTGKAVLS